MNELCNKEGSKRRLFVGRSKENNSRFFLYDENGKPKLKIYVDKNGIGKIEVIDNNDKIKNIIDTK